MNKIIFLISLIFFGCASQKPIELNQVLDFDIPDQWEVNISQELDFAPNLAPLWIICMWAGFTAQINHAMQFLIGRYYLIGFYGLLAPLAYLAGEGIGAAQVTDSYLAYGVISVAWSVSLLSLFKISEYLMSK